VTDFVGHAAGGGSMPGTGGNSVVGGAAGVLPSSGAVVAESSGPSLTGTVSVGSVGFWPRGRLTTTG